MHLEIHNAKGQVDVDFLTEEGRQHIIYLAKALISNMETLDYEERQAAISIDESGRELMLCLECGDYIDVAYGADEPAAHQGHAGTIDDPKAPGDYNDICDVCDYAR